MESRNKIKEWGLNVSFQTGNEIYCHCPFHADKGASLCINSKKPIWYCQSCERGGHLDKLEKLLAKEGIVDYEPVEEHRKKYPLAKMEIEDFEALRMATNCQYLVKRGFNNDSVRAWEIRRSTVFAVLPLKNKNNIVDGLILRAMMKDYEPRYQAKHFKKKDRLFGKQTSHNGNRMVVLVEGPLDAVKIWQHMNSLNMLGDFAGVYAAMGSSMSNKQIELLSKVSNDILILMDNEDSGRVATQKCAKSLLGFNLFVPRPDLYASEDPGAMKVEEFGNIISDPLPYLKARIEGILER